MTLNNTLLPNSLCRYSRMIKLFYIPAINPKFIVKKSNQIQKIYVDFIKSWLTKYTFLLDSSFLKLQNGKVQVYDLNFIRTTNEWGEKNTSVCAWLGSRSLKSWEKKILLFLIWSSADDIAFLQHGKDGYPIDWLQSPITLLNPTPPVCILCSLMSYRLQKVV